MSSKLCGWLPPYGPGIHFIPPELISFRRKKEVLRPRKSSSLRLGGKKKSSQSTVTVNICRCRPNFVAGCPDTVLRNILYRRSYRPSDGKKNFCDLGNRRPHGWVGKKSSRTTVTVKIRRCRPNFVAGCPDTFLGNILYRRSHPPSDGRKKFCDLGNRRPHGRAREYRGELRSFVLATFGIPYMWKRIESEKSRDESCGATTIFVFRRLTRQSSGS